MAISRRLPNSNLGRYTALRSALQQHNNAGGNSVLTNTTAARLAAIEQLYNSGMKATTVASAQSGDASNLKNLAQQSCRLYASHGLQTIMMAVQRGEMPLATLLLYNLDENSPALPNMTTEQNVLTAAQYFLNGEQTRAAAGDVPLPMPTAAQVQSRVDNFIKAQDTQNTAQGSLKDRQGEVDKLNAEADGVIKKVWDEVETFYNEKDDDTRRAFCRLWGVVYISDVRISLSGVLLTIVNGAAQGVENALITLVQGGEFTNSTTNGLYELKTGFTGEATITIEAPGMQTITLQKTIDGKGDMNLGETTMVP